MQTTKSVKSVNIATDITPAEQEFANLPRSPPEINNSLVNS